MPVLTQRDHERFIEDGLVVLRGLVPDQAIADAVDVLEKKLADAGAELPKLSASSACSERAVGAPATRQRSDFGYRGLLRARTIIRRPSKPSSTPVQSPQACSGARPVRRSIAASSV